MFRGFADISAQHNGRLVVVFDIRRNNVDVNDWSLFVLVPMRWPILDRIIADRKDQIRGVQECVCRLIGNLTNAATEVWKLLARDSSCSLKSSDNRKCRGAKQITNGIAELWFARHQTEQNHWRFRGIDKTRGVGKRSLASSALRNMRLYPNRLTVRSACHDIHWQSDERRSRPIGFSCAKRSRKDLCGGARRINFSGI